VRKHARDTDPVYRPAEYWGRLHERGGLSAVGQSGLPPVMNHWLYRSWARSVERLADRFELPRPGSRMYEVGAGTGYWLDVWRRRGIVSVDGCDLSDVAVTDLNERYGTLGRFSVADISEPDAIGRDVYDLVDCQNVLLHIVDDERFDRALETIARLVAPGGVLLLAEPILRNSEFERTPDPGTASRARPLARYADGLEACGLELVALEGYAVVANNPIEGSSRRWFRFWRASWMTVVALCRVLPGNARWVGPLVYALDGVLCRTGAAPSGKLALFRRPA
jgi:SAM-dependent methyltransferase